MSAEPKDPRLEAIAAGAAKLRVFGAAVEALGGAAGGKMLSVQRGVVERAFLLPNGQDGAAVRLDDGRLICGWAQERHAPGQGVEVCRVGGDEWGVLGPVEAQQSENQEVIAS